MAHSTPRVHLDTLLYQQSGQQHSLKVDTPEWYAWLSNFSTFAFRGEHGSFTARKEYAGNRRGGEYWKAYRTLNGKLHRAYLGKSEALTIERLNDVAFSLSQEKKTPTMQLKPSKPSLASMIGSQIFPPIFHSLSVANRAYLL